jgi:alpha-tubulin suppressor-like RCC1 family protein
MCWGVLGPQYYPSVPIQVTGLASGVTDVSVGFDFACAVTTGGGVKCWGYNGYGLGDGATSQSATPVQVKGITTGAIAVSVGDVAGIGTACAIVADGGVMCWGDDSSFDLGNGSDGGATALPVQVSGLTNGATDISVGSVAANRPVCAVITGGGVDCWGVLPGAASGTYTPVPVAVVGFP